MHRDKTEIVRILSAGLTHRHWRTRMDSMDIPPVYVELYSSDNLACSYVISGITGPTLGSALPLLTFLQRFEAVTP